MYDSGLSTSKVRENFELFVTPYTRVYEKSTGILYLRKF